MSPLRIAIIGGGPGGLTLARLLKLQGVPFRLFETDESHRSRSQGGTLDIHGDSGQQALKAAGLFAEFEKYARRDGAALKILGKDGTVVWADDGSEGPPDRPEIDRRVLRQLLLDSLDDGMVVWGKKVVGVSEDTCSTAHMPQFTVEFEGGGKEGGFELVVGADGAWSKVRGLLTNERPFYSSVTCFEARIEDIDTRYPDLAERVGTGSCFQVNDNSTLISQRIGDGSVRTYAMIRVAEDWPTTCGINWADHQASRQALINDKYIDWDALGKDFILRSDDPLVVRPLYMLPVEMEWKTRPGVTILGDAAHLMTPFAGVGVNLALTDSMDLSHAIHSRVQEKLNWTVALQQFEEKMLARARVEATKTFTNLTIFFSGDSIEVIVKKLGEIMTGGAGGDERANNQ